MDYYGYCIADKIICEYCGCELAVDLHHIIYRSQGGSDEAGNLIALGRKCHAGHHERNNPTTEQLKDAKKNIDNRRFTNVY